MLFDFIRSDYLLPSPKVFPAGADFDLTKVNFHTYSFPFPGMHEYEIIDDGQLYKWETNKEIKQTKFGLEIKDEGGRSLSKQDFTGEVFFLGALLGEEVDLYLSYRALFWKGELKEVSLEKSEEEDNKERKSLQEKTKKKIDLFRKRQESWKGDVVTWYIFSVRFVLSIFRWMLDLGFNFLWKLEKWLT